MQRTNNRVIAGVCGAIAQELGWNVTLVRVLMVVLAFMGGTGVFFYGLAWALLPDESDGSILLEDLIHGHWNWSFIGVILCILLSGVLVVPFFGFHGAVNVMPILLSALAMYLVIDHGRRRFMRPNSMNGGIGGNGGNTGGYGGPAPAPPMPPMPNVGERAAGPSMPAQRPERLSECRTVWHAGGRPAEQRIHAICAARAALSWGTSECDPARVAVAGAAVR